MVFLIEFFENVDFEKKSADDKKNRKNFPATKELILFILVGFSIHIDTMRMGLSILYCKEAQIKIKF